jgi:hypothetical protein
MKNERSCERNITWKPLQVGEIFTSWKIPYSAELKEYTLLPDEYHRCQKEECLAFGFVVST